MNISILNGRRGLFALLAAAVLVFPASELFGATNYILLPAASANQDSGGGADDFRSVMRIQECYGGALFPQQPITIRELRFRPSATVGFAFSTTISNIQINLATSSSQPESLSATFANNLGPDVTTVFNGALPMSSGFTGPAAGPKAFDMVVPLTTPFTFDPSKGNLIIDIINRSGSSASYIDSWGAHGDQTGRAWAYGVNPTTATYIDWGVEDVEIFYDSTTAPPPPQAGTYDIARDYSTNTNPSGVWSYGYKSEIGGPFVVYPRFYKNPENPPGLYSDLWIKNQLGYSYIAKNNTSATITSDAGAG